MATRSYIAKLQEDGNVKYIYCHYNGDVWHNGFILRDYYTEPAEVDRLLKLGDLSKLGPYIGKKHDFASYRPNWCTAYIRDDGRRDDNCRARIAPLSEIEQNKGIDYSYLFDPTTESWKYFNPSHPERGWREIPDEGTDEED
jgi:hypothetical protein